MNTPVCPGCGCSLIRLGIKAEDAATCIYDGKEYKCCCQGCVDVFLADPEPLSKEISNIFVCPVCLAEKHAEETVRRVLEGIEIHFCRCPACFTLFQKKPEYYLARLAGKTEFEGVFTDEERCCAATEQNAVA